MFCLFCCKIGLIILIDYINFAYLAVLLTKECIIAKILNKASLRCAAANRYSVTPPGAAPMAPPSDVDCYYLAGYQRQGTAEIGRASCRERV